MYMYTYIYMYTCAQESPKPRVVGEDLPGLGLFGKEIEEELGRAEFHALVSELQESGCEAGMCRCFRFGVCSRKAAGRQGCVEMSSYGFAPGKRPRFDVAVFGLLGFESGSARTWIEQSQDFKHQTRWLLAQYCRVRALVFCCRDPCVCPQNVNYKCGVV